MKIPVTLNGEKIVLEAHSEESLMKVLQKNHCLSVKTGCSHGFCGACTVLMDNLPVPSCKIPIGIAKGTEIITMEYFSKTPEYDSIMEGFTKAGIKLCGYCNAGKIFAALQIIRQSKIPSREEITSQVNHLSPCCTDTETLVNGIIYAIKLKDKKSTWSGK